MDVTSANEPLVALFADLDREIAAAQPVCSASGRCCRFAEYGHTLFLTRWEAELLTSVPPAAPAVVNEEGCPYQVAGLCTARERRPVGCRVYFCDIKFADRMPVITEEYISRLKSLHNNFGREWFYAPLATHLRQLLTAGGAPTNPNSLPQFLD